MPASARRTPGNKSVGIKTRAAPEYATNAPNTPRPSLSMSPCRTMSGVNPNITVNPPTPQRPSGVGIYGGSSTYAVIAAFNTPATASTSYGA